MLAAQAEVRRVLRAHLLAMLAFSLSRPNEEDWQAVLRSLAAKLPPELSPLALESLGVEKWSDVKMARSFWVVAGAYRQVFGQRVKLAREDGELRDVLGVSLPSGERATGVL